MSHVKGEKLVDLTIINSALKGYLRNTFRLTNSVTHATIQTRQAGRLVTPNLCIMDAQCIMGGRKTVQGDDILLIRQSSLEPLQPGFPND